MHTANLIKSSVQLGCVTGVIVFGLACSVDTGLSSGPVIVDPGAVTDCEFTEIEGTQMKRYDCNPVFTGTGEDWGPSLGGVGFHATEVLGHAFFQMWYAGYNQNGYGIGTAISDNGVDWTPFDGNPLMDSSPGWYEDSLDGIQVAWNDDAEEYVMMYQGIDFNYTGPTQNQDRNGLGIKTSTNGRDWDAFNGDQMVLNLSGTTGPNYCWPLGFSWIRGSGFFGFLGGGADTTPLSLEDYICEMYGFDGESVEEFTVGDQPILRAGPDAYDLQGMVSSTVVEFDGTLYMFYVGFNRWAEDPNGSWINATDSQLALATSTDDGATWQKHAHNPIPVDVVSGQKRVSFVNAQVISGNIVLWVQDYYPDLDERALGYFTFDPSMEGTY